jgi:hypothetical protein
LRGCAYGTPIAQARIVADKPTYARRRPDASALYQIVRDNLRTLYAAAEHRFAAPLPGFVREELEGFIDCGALARGFSVLACSDGRALARQGRDRGRRSKRHARRHREHRRHRQRARAR